MAASVSTAAVKNLLPVTDGAVYVRQWSTLTLHCQQHKQNGGCQRRYVHTMKTKSSFTDKHCTFY